MCTDKPDAAAGESWKGWPTVPEDPVPRRDDRPDTGGERPSTVIGAWPTRPEDPLRDDGVGVGKCPCYVRVRFIRVAGGSVSHILNALASLVIDNPDGKDLYHTALEVQIPVGEACVRHVVEMQDFIHDPQEAQRRGQVAKGDFGGSGASGISFTTGLWGPSYGIRRWPGGSIEDGDDPAVAHPGRLIVSRDCAAAQRLLALVPSVPTSPW